MDASAHSGVQQETHAACRTHCDGSQQPPRQSAASRRLHSNATQLHRSPTTTKMAARQTLSAVHLMGICIITVMLVTLSTAVEARKLTTTSTTTTTTTMASHDLRDYDYAMETAMDDTEGDQPEHEPSNEFVPRFKHTKNLNRILTKSVGSSIQLNCAAIGRPEPNITWFRNDTRLTREQARGLVVGKWSLSLDRLRVDDAGVYTCKVCNPLGCVEHASSLTVVDRDGRGTNATTRAPNTSHELNDYEDNEDHTDLDNRNAAAAASAGAAKKADDDKKESAPRFKNTKNLNNILSKPSGSVTTLTCPAVGNPEPTIAWTLNGTKIYRQMGRVKKGRWSITMEDLVPEDTGLYTCKVCNPLGCIDHTTKLLINDRVNHKPIPLTHPKNLTLPIGGSGQMECEFLSDLHSTKAWGFSPCNHTAGCAKKPDILKQDTNVFVFENVTKEQEGWYTCIGINGLGQSVSSAYLTVVNASQINAGQKIMRAQTMWVVIVCTVIILLLLFFAVFIVYVTRKLKHEKLLKQRIETVHQWTKKVIIYKPSSDSSGSMDTMIMPMVKIEKQRTTVLQNSNSEPAPFNEYEFPLDSNWEIARNQLILGNTLGEGAFGRVIMAEVNNSIVAVKMVKEGHTDDDIASLVREMEVMKIIGKHINIINLLGCCSQNGPLYVIVEFAPYGNLKDFLNKNRPTSVSKEYAADHQLPQPEHQLTEKHLISFAFQIARGMEYLASRRCIHRDLAARNVLVSDDYVMKIADFGLARDIQDTDYYRKNTNGRLPIKWMAPESLQDKFYDSQSDVWSYGVLLWEIMTFGSQPYPTIMSAEELYSYLMSGQRMEKPAKCSLNIYMLMRQCWHFDASARPTFTEIVENLDKLLLANEDYLDVAVANLETPPSSSDEADEEEDDESDMESLRYHFK